MSSKAFQRARRPEQKRQREQAILGAAAAVLEAEGPDGVTLTAVAAEVGLAKSNLYRYFESREDILLQLLVSDEAEWVAQLERALVPLAGGGDVAAVGTAMAGTLAANPRLCRLTSILTIVLEQNVSLEVTRRFKDRAGELSIRIGNAIHAACPGVPLERLAGFQRWVQALIAGLWPIAHPAPVVVELLAEPRYAGFAGDFESDLRRAITPLLASLHE